jgi:hypothetical protein
MLVALGALTVAAGCGASRREARAAGGVSYLAGVLEAHVKADPRQVADASAKVLVTRRLPKIILAASSLNCEVVGRTAWRKHVTITATREEAGGSCLRVRVGTLEQESASRKIYEEILKRLSDRG